MTRTAAIRGLLTGIVVLASSVTHAFAQPPTPADMMNPKLGPKLDDVHISSPTPDELRSCTVELVPGQVKGASGWLLKDPRGNPLRRFFDSNGDNKVDVWSYYKDGVEVYREFDTASKGTPNNFRWLNSAGMKWGVGGVDKGRGFITQWRMISPEEVGFEAFNALIRQDYSRMNILFLSDAEIQALKLPANKIAKIRATQQGVQAKFAKTARDIAGAKFDVVEGGVLECDNRYDVEIIRYHDKAIRYDKQGKLEFLKMAELIQVGMTWRLVDVPGGDNIIEGKGKDTELDKLLQQLAKVDENTPDLKHPLANDAQIDAYFRKRIPLLQKIIPLVTKADERENYYKQKFDNMLAMAQNTGDNATVAALTQMKDDAVAKQPGSNIAAYGTYRDLWCRYSIAMANPKNTQPIVKQIQDRWLTDLADFVKRYSKHEDTPEALHQLAIGCEFDGKNEEGKRWYKRLYEDFPNHALAPRARGSEARLSLVGNTIQLAAPLLNDPTKTFDIAQYKGRVVVVHYWGSYTEQHKDDFVRMQRIVSNYKDAVLVNVNLDESAAKAREAVTRAQAPGFHLFQATNNAAGLSSPLATQYGIHILPTIFVVGTDGRVTNNNVQVGDLDTELKKISVK